MPSDPSNAVVTPIEAGSLSLWLRQFRASLQGGGEMPVPCGDCVGCCVSSYSILVRPDESAALASIPAQRLRDVPELGRGIKAMGYLPDGTCPMLQAGGCSIYAARPATCRDYDCRVFAAAGLSPGDGKTVIEQRVRAWRFSYATEDERAVHGAIRAAAAFMREHGSRFPEHRWPRNASGLAVSAVKCYEVFLHSEPRDAATIAAAITTALRDFDARSVLP